MLTELLPIFINVVTPVFALVIIGYFAGPPLGLQARTLSRTAYYIFIPSFVFSVVSTAEFDLGLTSTMVLYIGLVHVVIAAVGYGLARALGRSPQMAGAYTLIAVFGNVGNFGLLMVEYRLGEAARLPGTIYFLAIMALSFVICVAVASGVQGGSMQAIWSVFKTPALLALIPSALFLATPLEVPLFLDRITGLLGQAMIPTMLVTLGVQLADIGRPKFSLDVVMASGVRLVGAPVFAALLVIPFGLTGLERGAGIIQAGMPAAVLTSIIAIEYDLIPEFVTTTVLFSTVISLFTLTVLMTLL